MKILNLDVKNVKIPIVFENSKTMPIVFLKLFFKVSGSLQDGKKQGLAKLSAKILNEGSSDLGSFEFAKALESRAISLEASASRESFCIELNCLKEHFDFALSMLKKMLEKPNLSEEILKKCKIMTSGEILNNANDNDYLARLNLMSVLYKNSALAQAQIGTQESISQISIEDISKFLSNHLDLNNLFISFGGDIGVDDMQKLPLVLDSLETGVKRKLEYFNTSNACEFSEIKKQSEQAYIYFGAPFTKDIEDRFKAKVAIFILGEGGFGSRLMEEIRVKRGLAYSAYARRIQGLSHSHILGYLQTKNENKDEAIAVVKDEFMKFVKNGVTKHEFEQTKRFLLGSLPLFVETFFKRIDIASAEFYEREKIGTFVNELEKIKKLKLSELNDFISSCQEINQLSFSVLYNEI